MSYARFKRDMSGVYVYRDATTGAYICADCAMLHKDCGATASTSETAIGMADHMRAHRKAGHLVPESTIAELELEWFEAN